MLMSAAVLCAACGKSDSPKDFKYTVDQFADLKVMRYRVPGWDDLTLKQKEYVYHLSEAAKWGFDIHWDQNCGGNLELRRNLVDILENYDGERSGEDWDNFLVYAKRVFFSSGIHHHYAEDKFFPECPREYFAQLLPDGSEKLLDYIYDPAVCPQRRCTSTDGDIVLQSSVNFYDGVTREEVDAYYAGAADPADPCPVSYGLNTKVVKENGRVVEKPWKSGGIYGPAIDRICEELGKAAGVAETEAQKHGLALLMEYYRSGDLRKWDEYNIEWLQDTLGTIDYTNGFVEDYNDPLGRKGAWEGIVNIKDTEASRRSEILSSNAQWFEDHSPVDPRFRKSEVRGVSAKVINVVALCGDSYPAAPLGINLPNADWIRRDHGSKSVTIANITHAYDASAKESPRNVLEEFECDPEVIERERKWGSLASEIHTDLHECLGHGSGKLLPGVSSGAMGEFSSTLEEARADLFGLYYCADPKMVELGLMPDAEAYKAAYSSYIRNGLMVQFNRIAFGKKNTEAHMQNRLLIARWCMEKGDGVIVKKTVGGKTYFSVTDYEALRNLFGELLGEIQRIKSEGDYEAGKALVLKYAVEIDPSLHREVIDRYASLNLKPYGGFINPEIVPVVRCGKVVDYRIEYCSDFLEQMLSYCKKYGVL